MANRRQQTAEENTAAWNRFFRETKVEMKKVIWPTKDQLIRYTITVIASVLLISCMLVGVDFVFMGLSKLLLSAVG